MSVRALRGGYAGTPDGKRTFTDGHANEAFALGHAIRAERFVEERVPLPHAIRLVRGGRADVGGKGLNQWCLEERGVGEPYTLLGHLRGASLGGVTYDAAVYPLVPVTCSLAAKAHAPKGGGA